MPSRVSSLGLLCAALASLALALAGCANRPGSRGANASLRQALTFHASFDQGTDADFALGDGWLYHAPGMNKWSEGRPGLPASGDIALAAGEGKYGQALRYSKASEAVVYYRAKDNARYSPSPSGWSGTISFWLRTDLNTLAPGFCDPLQFTPRAWDDASFFVEFERRTNEVPFRLGAYADKKAWNPLGRNWGDIPPAERPVFAVPGPPFARDRWTHVVFTWENFNTGRADGTATLYLDGGLVGAIRNRTQTYTWDPANARILMGVGYVGWFDDLAVFNRALTSEEIQVIRKLPAGIRSLRQ